MAAVSVLTDLPRTVLLNIMEYLSPIDCYRSMHNINHKLDAIIRSSTTHINLSNIELKEDFDYYLEHILPDIIISLRSLKISNDFLFEKEQRSKTTTDQAMMIGIIKKVQAKINLSAYEKLEKLTLQNVNAAQLNFVSQKLVDISHLKCLVIDFNGTIADIRTSIFDNDAIRSKLSTLTLTLSDANVVLSSSFSANNLPNLDYLTVDFWRAANVPVLFSLVQNIKYLNIYIGDFPNQPQTYTTGNFTLPHLTCLKLTVDEMTWAFVEHLLKQCGQKLKHFTFRANDVWDFIDPEKWKKLITTHLKQLTKFSFHITLWETSISASSLALFNTEFWHKLNVHVACDSIECSYEQDTEIVDIYTVPFYQSSFRTAMSTKNIVTPPFINSSYERIQTLNIFLDKKPLRGTKRIYEKVDSIIFESLLGHDNDILRLLNMSVICNNIHHFGFSSVRAALKPEVFWQLLQQCSNVYSLKLYSETLNDMTTNFTNEKICLLLNNMIKHIQFHSGIKQEDLDEQIMKKFVQTFSNLERIFVHMKSSDDVLKRLSVMIYQMKKLNKIFIKTIKPLPNGFIDQTRETIRDLKESYIRKEKSYLFIWRSII